MTKYNNWKGLDGIQRAEDIEEKLRAELGRRPRKKDFINNGYYGAWMALYRYRKNKKTIAKEGLEEIYLNYRKSVRISIYKTKNKNLLEKIFKDMLLILGQARAERIFSSVKEKMHW